ncbi:hypothetical protein [Actinomadura sp. HBU206391]|uniref:hypothetical protein n=1 Tax=Actinomadura sp. HBU206391 TaxID=2731692 RepID=UPI001650AE38|nr:hypothetical protein [Actinomadura sp. HBU206391]MBC6460880.1 hypothetical protein [Actinomadura sp. HBU206391]
MAYRWEPPSPAEAVPPPRQGAASQGKAEAVRQVRIPPSAPDVPPRAVRWRAYRYLDRLARELGRAGWSSVARYEESPPSLRVFAAPVPCVGETVTVVAGPGKVWWFRSSLGHRIAPCSDVAGAAWEIAVLLTPWVAAALTRDGRGRHDVRRSDAT